MRGPRIKNSARGKFLETNMIDVRRMLVALMLVAVAVPQRPGPSGPGGGERPNRPEQNQRGGLNTSRAAPASCHCCLAMPSPSTASISPSGKLAYTATAGTLSLFDQSGERSAAVFYTAYVAKNDNPPRGR